MSDITVYHTECEHYKNGCDGSNSWHCVTGNYKKRMDEHEKHIMLIAQWLAHENYCDFFSSEDLCMCEARTANANICVQCLYNKMMNIKPKENNND